MDEMADPKIYNPPWLLIAREDYTYFIWHFLYNYLLQFAWAIFTIMLSLGGLSYEHERGSALFTLSLPINRQQLFLQRVWVGFVEASILALVPAVLIPLLSRSIGLSYSSGDAFSHALLFIGGGTVYYTMGVLLNALIKTEALAFFICIGIIILFYFFFQPYSDGMEKPFHLKLIDLPGFMSGPASPKLFTSNWWSSIGGCLGVSALFFFLSYRITLKRDF
jgi:hypothetical protein